MQKRIRLQKMLIFGLAVVISVLLVGLLVGRNNTVPVVIINSDQVDLTKPLSEQPELLKMDKMSRKEYEMFGGTIVTSLEEIKGARLKFPLAPNSPVITSALTKNQTAGQFAVNTPQYHTVFKMPEIVGSLPPGIQAGDRVDIDLMVEQGQSDSRHFMIGPLLQNIKVSGVEETTLYLVVSQREYASLAVARQVGSFVVQLPGQKQVGTCTEVNDFILAEKDAEILALAKDEEYTKLDEASQNEKLTELNERYELRLQNIECFNEHDKPTTLTSDLLIEKVKEGKSFQEIFNNDIEINIEDDLVNGLISPDEEEDGNAEETE